MSTLRILAAGPGRLFLGLPIVDDESPTPKVYTPGRVEIGFDPAGEPGLPLAPALVIEFSDVHSYARWLRRLADEADDFIAGAPPVSYELTDGSRVELRA